MMQLFPETSTTEAAPAVDPRSAVEGEDRPPPADRPWVYTNMIASADGATAVDGLSGALGGSGDRAVFGALRSMADVILAGSTTVSEERYRVPDPDEATRDRRRQRGQAERPRIAVVSASLGFDLDLPLFTEPEHRPLIIAPDNAPADRVARLEAVADIVRAGDDSVDLATALTELAALGARTVLCEGGPSLNGQLVAAGLVDEWNLTISPHLVGGDAKRAAVGSVAAGPPTGMRLRRVWSDDSHLFCRWTRDD